MAAKSALEGAHATSNLDNDDFDKHLSENTVEYLIFNIDAKSEAKTQLSQLEAIRQSALKLSNSLSKDYIWQKDEFNIELKNQDGKFWRQPLH